MRLGISGGRTRGGKGKIILVAFLLFVIAAVFVMVRLQGAFIEYAEKYADNIANKLVNEAVQRVCSEESFSNISEVRDGGVKTVETNASKVNRLRAELSGEILNSVNNGETVRVPLGTATGVYFLSGMGPKIPIKVSPAGVVSTDLRDEFTAAGINQVYHKIYIDVTIDMSFVGLAVSDTKTVTVTALVSETVIVGDTPQYYGAGELAIE